MIRETPVRASGLLKTYCDNSAFELIDAHLAMRLAELCGEDNEQVILAIALTVRALREGSVCLPLSKASSYGSIQQGDDTPIEPLHWPKYQPWLETLRSSPAISQGTNPPANRPVRLSEDLLYLEKYWQIERFVEKSLILRRNTVLPEVNETRLAQSIARWSDSAETQSSEVDWQTEAAKTAVKNWTSVIVGGPGTGKTRTVAKILQVLADQDPNKKLKIGLAAPSGKAAQRLDFSVKKALNAIGSDLKIPGGLTLHKLLDSIGLNTFRRNSANPLDQDIIIIDEFSMVSLPMMSKLLDALKLDTRLVLVGDSDQLASIDAGAVLADIVDTPQLLTSDRTIQDPIVRLRKVYRYGKEIAACAEAIRKGDTDELLSYLERPEGPCKLVNIDCAHLDFSNDALTDLAIKITHAAQKAQKEASLGNASAALDAIRSHQLLCAHREGPYGVNHWNQLARHYLAKKIPNYGYDHEHYLGQPLLVTENSGQLWNGDCAVIFQQEANMVAAIARTEDTLIIPPFMLGSTEEMHALTIHKSQGSQFNQISIILPDKDSPLLTRQLLYTALTRAEEDVVIYATKESIRKAVETPARRASGLASYRTATIA